MPAFARSDFFPCMHRKARYCSNRGTRRGTFSDAQRAKLAKICARFQRWAPAERPDRRGVAAFAHAITPSYPAKG